MYVNRIRNCQEISLCCETRLFLKQNNIKIFVKMLRRKNLHQSTIDPAVAKIHLKYSLSNFLMS